MLRASADVQTHVPTGEERSGSLFTTTTASIATPNIHHRESYAHVEVGKQPPSVITQSGQRDGCVKVEAPYYTAPPAGSAVAFRRNGMAHIFV